MTRQELIEQAAIEYCGGNKGADARVRGAFLIGAEWADEHPQKKSKWTEDDEELYQDTLDAFEALVNDLNPSVDWGKLYDWLKSIKKAMEE